MQLYVRERACTSHYMDADRLFRVGGVMDVALWQVKSTIFYDLGATTIKKQVTGNGRASKQEVAKNLDKYVGEQEYATNDESDAIAVGIAYLIKEGYMDAR